MLPSRTSFRDAGLHPTEQKVVGGAHHPAHQTVSHYRTALPSQQVVGSAWLSECIRLGSAQPMGSHLLDTITPSTAKKFNKKSPAAAGVAGGSGSGSGGGSGGVSYG